VPAPFAARIPLAAHQKAADYTIARTRFGMLHMAFSAAVLMIALTGPNTGTSSLVSHLLVTVVVFAVAKYRWLNHSSNKRTLTEIPTDEAAQ